MDVEVSVFLQSDVVLIDESGIGSELWTQQNFNGTRVMTRRLGSISSDSNVVMSFRLGPEARKRKSISFQVCHQLHKGNWRVQFSHISFLN